METQITKKPNPGGHNEFCHSCQQIARPDGQIFGDTFLSISELDKMVFVVVDGKDKKVLSLDGQWIWGNV